MILQEWDRTEPGPALAATLADIHRRAFADDSRAWSGPEILDLIGDRAIGVCLARREAACAPGRPDVVGFGLYRVAADEAELLTLAVLPDARRAGCGARLLAACAAGARRRGAVRMFLEVSEANVAARALYGAAGFADAGRRKGYYRRADGSRADAIVLVKPLAAEPPGRRGSAGAHG